jgi:hypothetical protein
VRRAVLILGAVLMLVVVIPLSWLCRRDHKLRGFCASIHAELPVADLLKLEKHDGIDASYMVGPEMFAQQLTDRDLDFRSFPLDPNFVCWIQHDGSFITSARIVE